MTEDNTQFKTSITAAEIAEMAGVSRSAVSNWKRRHADFPADVDGSYDRDQVVAWLRDAGYEPTLKDESITAIVWNLADAIRGVLRVDEMPEVLLQLFVLRAASSGRYGRLVPLADAWDAIRMEPQGALGVATHSIAASVADTDPELARALRFSHAVNRFQAADWDYIVSLIDRLDPDTTDWSTASNAIVTGFVDRHGAKGGEHSSGSSLIDVMMALLEPVEGTVYDPACGSAAFLAAAWSGHPGAITRLYGQEVNEHSWRLGFLHLILQNADFDLVTGDTLVDDRLWELRADRIALEPPLNLHLRSIDQMRGDPRWIWGLPQKSSADLAWVQHVVAHLAESGVGVVVVSPAALFRGGRSEAEIRMGLVNADLVDAVVYLPPGMLASSSVSVAMVVLQKNRANRSGSVLFIDARQLGRPERGSLRRFEPSEVEELRNVIQAWRAGSFVPEAQFTGVGTAEEIITANGVLNPNRYISYAEAATEIDGEPIQARYGRLLGEAEGRLAALPELEASIRQQLSTIEVADD